MIIKTPTRGNNTRTFYTNMEKTHKHIEAYK